MGGTTRKPDKPRPSYEQGIVRDAEIERLQREAAKAGDDQRGALRSLIAKSTKPHKS